MGGYNTGKSNKPLRANVFSSLVRTGTNSDCQVIAHYSNDHDSDVICLRTSATVLTMHTTTASWAELFPPSASVAKALHRRQSMAQNFRLVEHVRPTQDGALGCLSISLATLAFSEDGSSVGKTEVPCCLARL